jgi:hypothetical protein
MNDRIVIDGREIIVAGSIIKIAKLKEEWDNDIEETEEFIKKLKTYNRRIDIFSFMQRIPESRPKFKYPMKWDNVAAIPIQNYDYWYNNVLHPNPRNKIKIAKKKGVVVKLFELNDESLKGIMEIYHENPLRQGKYFTDYRIDTETARKANETFLERAVFIGAYFKNELIGFVKLVSSGKIMRTMGILGKIKHRDKAPMNLLISKAVEVCAEKNIPYLVYGKFSYGKVGSDTLKQFKLYLGFESICLPRYFIPFNSWGKNIVKLNLQEGIINILPKKLIKELRMIPIMWDTWKYSKK